MAVQIETRKGRKEGLKTAGFYRSSLIGSAEYICIYYWSRPWTHVDPRQGISASSLSFNAWAGKLGPGNANGDIKNHEFLLF
jgi:hypothetical protein